MKFRYNALLKVRVDLFSIKNTRTLYEREFLHRLFRFWKDLHGVQSWKLYLVLGKLSDAVGTIAMCGDAKIHSKSRDTERVISAYR